MAKIRLTRKGTRYGLLVESPPPRQFTQAGPCANHFDLEPMREHGKFTALAETPVGEVSDISGYNWDELVVTGAAAQKQHLAILEAEDRQQYRQDPKRNPNTLVGIRTPDDTNVVWYWQSYLEDEFGKPVVRRRLNKLRTDNGQTPQVLHFAGSREPPPKTVTPLPSSYQQQQAQQISLLMAQVAELR